MQEPRHAQNFRLIAEKAEEVLKTDAYEKYFDDLFSQIHKTANLGYFHITKKLPILIAYGHIDFDMHPSEIHAYMSKYGFVCTWDRDEIKISWGKNSK